MKLDQRPSNTSFYETFSDLMFATLVVFLLIVMVLVVQFRSSTDEILARNRFTGATDGAVTIAAVEVDGAPHVVFLPTRVASQIGINNGDFAWEWAGWLADGGGRDRVTTIPIDRWDELKDAISLRTARSSGRPVIQVNLAHWTVTVPLCVYNEQLGGAVRLDQQSLYKELGGENSEAFYNSPLPDRVERFYRTPYADHLLGPVLDSIIGDRSDSFLRFGVREDRKVLLDRYVCEPADLRNILSAISPSQDFYLEYVSEDSPGEAPPDWVVEEILRPVGWDRRVIADGYREAGAGDRESDS